MMIRQSAESGVDLFARVDPASRIVLRLTKYPKSPVDSVSGFGGAVQTPQRIGGASQDLGLSAPGSDVVLDLAEPQERVVINGQRSCRVPVTEEVSQRVPCL